MTGTSAIDRLRPEDPPRLGDYRIVGRIGRGGMGIVHLGESARGERVAVKVISPDLADDEMFRDRFRREVESARRVKGRRNRVQAACEERDGGIRLRLWLNGTLAADTSDHDGPLANGTSGLVAVQENGGSAGDVQVLFDDFGLSAIR
ncbi:hypothetical protein [Actinoallomurus rhizosphaericola]|uniref:hypothetical protein n=1 Tax=Actinoallomurus rhizosphaericola TaxID=2952536 RepID=UPI0027E23B19|nr:hypothetical protein [Actinoallomurus rhizosphaericola]